jgi:hypothetical protein
MNRIHDSNSKAEHSNFIQNWSSPVILRAFYGKELSEYYGRLVNRKRNREIVVSLQNKEKATALGVDPRTDNNPARAVQHTIGKIKLGPFAVTTFNW